MSRGLLLIAFGLSGAAALVYEVAWSRALVVTVGNTPLVHALTVAAFMLGLGGGALWGTKLARGRRPLLRYAALELGVAIAAVVAPWGRELLRSGYRLAVDAEQAGMATEAVRAAAVLVGMGTPALLLGATYPLLVSAWTRGVAPGRASSASAADAGMLYGVNTLGAVAGTLVAGFALLPALGAFRASLVAAAASVLAGGLALAAERRGTQPPPDGAPAGVPDMPAGARSLLILYGLAAFCTLGLQLAWIRLLALHLRGVTYTFTAVLAVNIAGLALGDLAGAWWVRRRPRADLARWRFGVAMALAGIAVLAALAASGSAYELGRAVEWLSPPRGTAGFCTLLLAVSACLLLVPTFLLGLAFPLAAAGVVGSSAGAGRAAGWLYFAGAIGGAAGAIVGAVVLVPGLGVISGIWVLALAVWALGLAAAASTSGRRRWLLVVPLVLGGSVALSIDRDRPVLQDTRVFRSAKGWGLVVPPGGSIEGLAAIVTVVDDTRTGDRFLYTDEFAATSTASTAAYMRLLGHLPALAAVGDELEALVLCYGTGTTAASVAAHQRVSRLDIVEISPEVLDVSPFFIETNRDVLADPRVVTHVSDGRDFLATARRRWHLISLEPLLPSTPQAVHFYTREFYDDAAGRLAEGGVLCQWVPVHAADPEEFRALVGTFALAFPDTATLWFFEESVALLGGLSPEEIARSLESRQAVPDRAVAADLARAGILGAEQLAGSCVLGPRGLAAYTRGIRPVTDDHPWTEWYRYDDALTRRAYLVGTLEGLADAAEAAGVPPLGSGDPAVATRWRATLSGMRGRATERRADVAFRRGEGADTTMLLLGRAISFYDRALQEGGTPQDPVVEERRREALSLRHVLRGRRRLAQGDVPGALAAFEEAEELDRDDPDLILLIATCLRRSGRSVAAGALLAELVGASPRHAEAYLELARLHRDLGETGAMHDALSKARALRPRDRRLAEKAAQVAHGR